MLYKPTGYLTTYRDPQGRKTIYDLLQERDRYLFPVGRLDLDTSGLLILTAFAERMTNPDYKIPKTYLVKASKKLSDEDLDRLRNGIELRDGPTRSAKVEHLRALRRTLRRNAESEGNAAVGWECVDGAADRACTVE
ncbi:MAG: pseudouridine synthase [Vicinamibacterales bacterium]